MPRYYGVDKIKSKSELIASIYRASREFYRVLVEDGLLWLKWCENEISINRVVLFFEQFTVLLKLHNSDPAHTSGKSKVYWVCFYKKKSKIIQKTLGE